MAMSGWAKRHGITLVGGSFTEEREGHEKLSNTCPVFDPEGELVAVYRKIHMFDVEVGGQVYRESETEEPGEEIVACEAEGWRLGLTICYDVRFPELYRILALDGAELITVAGGVHAVHGQGSLGAARPRPSGREPALRRRREPVGRSRAGQGELRALARSSTPGASSSPCAADEDTVVSAEIDRSQIDRIRRSVPSLANRQPAAYRWPAGV